jgi:hypothetical protein
MLFSGLRMSTPCLSLTRRFNLVTCRRAAHHFSDIQRALQEILRVMARVVAS